MYLQENQFIKILFLRKLLRDLQTFNGSQKFGKFGIGVTKYELCSNFKDSNNFQFISTIKLKSNDKITYQVSLNKFKNEGVNIYVSGISSYVEQISNQTLLISGGIKEDERRFLIHNLNNKTLEFQMDQRRKLHRTNFDKSSFIFIISGLISLNVKFLIQELRNLNKQALQKYQFDVLDVIKNLLNFIVLEEFNFQFIKQLIQFRYMKKLKTYEKKVKFNQKIFPQLQLFIYLKKDNFLSIRTGIEISILNCLIQNRQLVQNNSSQQKIFIHLSQFQVKALFFSLIEAAIYLDMIQIIKDGDKLKFDQ